MRAPAKGLTRELQVGIFVFIGMLIIGAFSFKITDSPIFRRGTRIYVHLNDATGIFKASKVKVAGINIGVIQEIELDGTKAKVTIILDEGIEIPANSRFVPRPLGILGDKYLEIVLPQNPVKDPESVQPEGAQIEKNLIERLWDVWGPNLVHAADLPARSPGAKKTLLKEGDYVTAEDSAVTLDDITRQLGTVSEDIKVISKDIRHLVSGNKDKIGDSLNSVNKILKKIDRILESFDEKRVKKGIRDMSHSFERIADSVNRVNNISRKIDEGEGTVGRLINDPETVEQLNRTLVAINSTVERAKRTQLILDLSTEYNFMPAAAKTYVGALFQSNEDTGYFAQLIADEGGTVKKKTETTTVNGGSPTVTETETREPYKWRYSLQFMKAIHNLRFRLGVFESTGGVGLDAHFFDQQLRATAEIFDFGRSDNRPELKLRMSYYFWSYFYFSVGGDDLLSKRSGAEQPSVFTGVGLSFNDQDIKSLLSFSSLF